MAALVALHPDWQPIVARTGLPPLRLREGGFPGLAAIIVSQQLSVASARAVWNRFAGVFVPLTPERVLAATDDDMRLSGLSRPKQRTLLALATALVEDCFAFAALEHASPEEVHAQMTAISGIGPWTACLSAVLPWASRRFRRRRPRHPGGRPPRLRLGRSPEAGRAPGHGGSLAALARRRRAAALGGLRLAQAPRGHQCLTRQSGKPEPASEQMLRSLSSA